MSDRRLSADHPSRYRTMVEHLADLTKHVPSADADPIAKRSYIEARLEYAGATNIALISRVGPIEFRGPAWATGIEDRLRFSPPTARAISLMDEAHGWIFHCLPDERLREVVGRRTLVLPDSDPRSPRYVWSWRRLCTQSGLSITGPNVEGFRRRWISGVDRITGQIMPRSAAILARAA